MDRSFKHWTPLYIKSRIKSYIYYKNNPDKPWLTQDTIKFLDSYLTKEDEVLEFGSGKSTLYFANKCKRVTSFENNPVWFKSITNKINKNKLSNIIYNYYTDELYYKEILSLKDFLYDIILIDGVFRPECTKLSLQKLKIGGLLIIDNANWYFPNNSLAPNSKRFFNNADNEDLKWIEVYDNIKFWRKYWTSNNITDTLLLFKPSSKF